MYECLCQAYEAAYVKFMSSLCTAYELLQGAVMKDHLLKVMA